MGRPDLELLVTVRDGRWVVEGPGVRAQAARLSDVEAEVERQVRESGRFAPGTPVEVFLACDRRVIPEWMRPYQTHYFNRTLSFVL